MKNRAMIVSIACAAMMMGWFFAGCSSVPDVQIESATLAIAEMNKLEADQYNIDSAKEAQASWSAAQRFLDEKKYTEAKPLLIKAKTQADLALRKVKSTRELKKRETESWVGTIDARYQTLKTGYQNRSANFKPEQKKQMEEQFAKIDQTNAEFRKELEAARYYKTVDMGKKTMGTINEGEALLKEFAK